MCLEGRGGGGGVNREEGKLTYVHPKLCVGRDLESLEAGRRVSSRLFTQPSAMALF